MTQSRRNKKNGRGGNKPYEATMSRMMVAARNPVSTRRFVLSIQGNIGSSGAGIIAGAFGMDPSGSAEWSSLALVYDQFRVLGGQLKLACCVPNTVVLSSLVRFAYDNDSAATPSSYADVMAYSEVTDVPAIWTSGSVKTVNFRRPVLRGVPQSEQLWYNETSPSTSPGSLKFYGTGLTSSTNYWNYILDYLVEFQMRS